MVDRIRRARFRHPKKPDLIPSVRTELNRHGQRIPCRGMEANHEGLKRGLDWRECGLGGVLDPLQLHQITKPMQGHSFANVSVGGAIETQGRYSW